MENQSKTFLIVDNGAGSIKAGLSNSETPKIIPNVIGRPKGSPMKSTDDIIIGQEAIDKRDSLEIENVIDYGIIRNWDIMQKMWDHCFKNELKVDPKEYDTLITERVHNKASREKITEIAFETYEVPSLYICDTSVLTLYGTGLYTGMVIDSGECTTKVVPFSEGTSFKFNVQTIGVDGRLLTNYLRENLGGGKLVNTVDYYMAKELKELFCTVALDFEDEIKYIGKTDYELPDGKQIFIEKERLICPEIIFEPGYYSKTYSDFGLAEGCKNCINACPIDVRKELYKHIVLSGGNTMFNGFPERIEKEVKDFAPTSVKPLVKIISNPDRQNMVWSGAATIPYISPKHFMTKNEYKEGGIAAIEKKFSQVVDQ